MYRSCAEMGMSKPIFAALAIGGVIGVAGCAPGTSAAAETHTISGSMQVRSFDGCGPAGMGALESLNRMSDLGAGGTVPCPDGPGGGYRDIADGAQVTISDNKGAVLAVGALKSGTLTLSGVHFDFTIPNVPDTDIYQVDVSNRGSMNYARETLASNGWNVALQLG
jgi:hypothetical protein